MKVENVAAVLVTTELPSYARQGARLDVTASSVGDARSLQGGILLPTALRGPDGRVRAMAQGPLSLGGFGTSGGAGGNVTVTRSAGALSSQGTANSATIFAQSVGGGGGSGGSSNVTSGAGQNETSRQPGAGGWPFLLRAEMEPQARRMSRVPSPAVSAMRPSGRTLRASSADTDRVAPSKPMECRTPRGGMTMWFGPKCTGP